MLVFTNRKVVTRYKQLSILMCLPSEWQMGFPAVKLDPGGQIGSDNTLQHDFHIPRLGGEFGVIWRTSAVKLYIRTLKIKVVKKLQGTS